MARAEPRGRLYGRTPARASLLRAQPVPVRIVPHFPTRCVDLGPQPIGFREIALYSRLLTPQRQLVELRRRLNVVGERDEPEDVERALEIQAESAGRRSDQGDGAGPALQTEIGLLQFERAAKASPDKGRGRGKRKS